MLKIDYETVFNTDRYKFNDALRECISKFQEQGYKVTVTYSSLFKKYTAEVTATKEIVGEQVSLI